MIRKPVLLLVLTACHAFLAGGISRAETPPSLEGVGVTVYNDDFAVVRQSRQMSFDKGTNTVRFTDVASAIDPTSVNFKCLSAPAAVSVLEQNYQYDLVSADSLLKRYIDKNVTVSLKGSGADTGRRASGRLMAAMGSDLVLKTDGNDIEIISRENIEDISLSEMPDDLVTRPTLVWLANAKDKGSQFCQVTYTTSQIGWSADYCALLNADETKIDFSGWVTINNRSGAAYKDASIKLIAGDVKRASEPRPVSRKMMTAEAGSPPSDGFEEKSFMEYHLYTLGRKSTLNNNEVKQIEFITPAENVAVKKLYIYDRRRGNDKKVQIKLEFENGAENKLGIALPKGRVRVFKKDPADDTLEFVGEDRIDHTARKEKLLLYIGNAFDIAAEYTLADSLHERRMSRETHKVEFRNRKTEAVEVFADEGFSPGVNWTIDKATHKYEQKDANTARFSIKIGADSVETLQYTVTQTW